MSHLSIIITAVVIVLVLILIVRIKKSRCATSSQLYPEGEQLYVGNLSYHVNTHNLKEFFSKYGDVQHIRLIKNPRTGRSKGFAFVTYRNVKDAKKALASNGLEMRGRAIVVRMAKPREE